MINNLKPLLLNKVRHVRNLLLKPAFKKIDQQNRNLKVLCEANFRVKATIKHTEKKAIHVIFVCHSPALWSMFETLYNAVIEDNTFIATVIILPYKHISLKEGTYKDEGMFEFLQTKKIISTRGYDKEKNEWISPVSLDPDYIFFQTPYDLFPYPWEIESISLFARVCYLSYGTCLFSGDVEKMVHSASLYENIYFFFMELSSTEIFFLEMFNEKKYCHNKKVVLTGHPKLELILSNNNVTGDVWPRKIRMDIKRVLWTPRWVTSDGTCHFFDYKNYFTNLCESNLGIDFVFRPHPLCFQNFLKTGELSLVELEEIEGIYGQSLNMCIDKSGEYVDTFLSSDILISDVSSMILEYFITGKPIIYLHRLDVFNDLGRVLSEGMYWVRNEDELNTTLNMLLSGEDRLKEKREKIIKEIFYCPVEGTANKIKKHLKDDYSSCIDINFK